MEQRLLLRPQLVWYEEPYWRLCCYASNHELIRLISEGWELFEDD